MFVSSILDEAKDVLGRCDDTTVFRRITDAVKLANTGSAGNDWNIALMDLCVCDGCITLPADVGTILAANNGGAPTLLRDQWFEFHANGSGSECSSPFGYTTEYGPVCTFRDPSGPVVLIAVVENSLDSNRLLRVYGWDESGKRIYTAGANGSLEDGFLVPTTFGFSAPNPAAPAITRIDRIQKDATNGFVKLIALDSTTLASSTLIGYYLPWETTPSYRRIRVPDRSWIRIKYRRKDMEVRSASDWINLEHREALMLLLKAVKFRLDNSFDNARAAEGEGLRLLSQEAETLRPAAISPPQIIFNDGLPSGNVDQMWGGWAP